MNTQDIENALSMNTFLQWLNEVNEDRRLKPGIWFAKYKNKEIKEKFANEFANFSSETGKIKCRYSDPDDSENSEFLYDFSVIEWKKQVGEDSEEPSLLRTILAMELEFSDKEIRKGWKGGIKYDFHKLLQADAPYKIMAFYMRDDKDPDVILNAFNELETAAIAYKKRCDSELLLWGCGHGRKRRTCHRIISLRS